jgi:hypothetical protein
VARLYVTVGPRRLISTGLLGTAAIMALCTQIEFATDLWLVRLLMFGAGCAMAAVFLPLNAATFARISSADTGRASAIFNTQRRVAAASGVAILATTLTVVDPSLARLSSVGAGADRLTAFHVVFLIDAVIAVAGAVVALAIRDADAAATMRSQPRGDVDLSRTADAEG